MEFHLGGGDQGKQSTVGVAFRNQCFGLPSGVEELKTPVHAECFIKKRKKYGRLAVVCIHIQQSRRPKGTGLKEIGKITLRPQRLNLPSQRTGDLAPQARVLRCRHRYARRTACQCVYVWGLSCQWGGWHISGGLTLVLTWLMAGGRESKGLVACETTVSPLLLRAFFKGSEVVTLKNPPIQPEGHKVFWLKAKRSTWHRKRENVTNFSAH